MTRIIGIDPGAKGAMVDLLVNAQTQPIVLDFGPWVLDRLAALPTPGVHVYLEWVIPIQKLMPSFVGAYKMGVNFGELQGVLKAAKIPYTLVRPREWQKVMFMGTSDSLPTKERARQVATRIFPGVELCGPKGGFKDGRADALCIAEFGRRMQAGVSA